MTCTCPLCIGICDKYRREEAMPRLTDVEYGTLRRDAHPADRSGSATTPAPRGIDHYQGIGPSFAPAGEVAYGTDPGDQFRATGAEEVLGNLRDEYVHLGSSKPSRTVFVEGMGAVTLPAGVTLELLDNGNVVARIRVD